MKYILILALSSILSNTVFCQQDTLKLYFATDKFTITSEHEEDLNCLNNIKANHIKIEAYTDAPASSKYNQDLSQKRAYTVYYYLLNHGIDIAQIDDVVGFGEQFCIKTDSPSALNRKVEIIYTSYKKSEKLNNASESNNAKLSVLINAAEIGDKLIIRNIHFYPGSHFHLPQSEPELQELKNILTQNPNMKIEIQGHICCQSGGLDGFDKDSKDHHLSINRAKHIFDYLIQNGIDASRLSYKGFGSSKKIYKKEMNEQERIANRRVEILILEK